MRIVEAVNHIRMEISFLFSAKTVQLFQTYTESQDIHAIFAHVLNYVASERDHGSILCVVDCLLKLLFVCPTGRLAV